MRSNSTDAPIDSTILTLIGLPVRFLMLFFLFPLYIAVNRANRKRDEKTAIFHYFNHFRQIVCVNQVIALGLLALLVYGLYQYVRHDNFTPIGIMIFLTEPYFAFLFIVPSACDVLTALLAFSRFLLYFFPVLGEKVKITGKLATYLLIILCYSFYTFLLFYESLSGNEATTETASLSSDVFLVLAIIPYLVLIRKIKKFSYLTSSMQSKPEEYIKYQIVIIFFNKLSSIYFKLKVIYGDDGELFFNTISNGTVTFIAIQLAYLFTNHANASEILKMRWSWKTLQFIFCGVKAEVQPIITTVSSTVAS